ncbi:hypothetical protein FQN54_001758 [Arachnomyces sp. PD_36]|nr:hypothetical protein FQN54_001758 [Arachnomyces sp. PD_36]
MPPTPGTSTFERKHTATASASAIRPSFRQQQAPHTPPQQQRSIHSPYGTSSSPGSSFRHEEDAVIFELGSRWLRAGFEGESVPLCAVGFGPEEKRRVGDYRAWLRNGGEDENGPRRKRSKKAEEWASEHELWRMDLRDLDLGLVEDKIERSIREVYNKYLLTDAGSSRMVLILPSVMPHPLLSSILSTAFNRWRYPSITLLPSATMATVAAGLRTALVVDIGWAETTVTGLYEYREIHSKRSTRAVKLLMQEMGKLLSRLEAENSDETPENKDEEITVSFEFCEEIVTRLAWCKLRRSDSTDQSVPATETLDSNADGNGFANTSVSIPLSKSASSDFSEVPFSKLSEPVEKSFFADGIASCDLDDEEKPLDALLYDALLALPPDVRGSCMSRVIFTGGGSHIPGLRQRILEDVGRIIERHGWSSIRGKIVEQQAKLKQLNINSPQYPSDAPSDNKSDEGETTDSGLDFVEEKLMRNNKDAKPHIHGVLREVESLGAWAGASLVTSLKARGLVEIERERFLQHGLAGASRDFDVPASSERRSGLGPGLSRTGGDRSSWTLGAWG